MRSFGRNSVSLKTLHFHFQKYVFQSPLFWMGTVLGFCICIFVHGAISSSKNLELAFEAELQSPTATLLWKHPSLLDIPNFRWLIYNESQYCRHSGSLSQVVILVHSARSHHHNRLVIRKTWGSLSVYKTWRIKLLFLLGQSSENMQNINARKEQIRLFREQKRHGDLIMGNFVDDYYNLTYKHLMGYKWTLNFCPNASFVIKCDDDMFVDIIRWLDWVTADLRNNALPDMYCAVHLPNGSKPVRDISSTWDITYDQYPRNWYPPHCLGGVYGTTVSTMRKLYSVISNVTHKIFIDDVFVTGLLMEEFRNKYVTWVPKIKDMSGNTSLRLHQDFLKNNCLYGSGDGRMWRGRRKFTSQGEINRDENFESYMMCLWKKVVFDYFTSVGIKFRTFALLK